MKEFILPVCFAALSIGCVSTQDESQSPPELQPIAPSLQQGGQPQDGQLQQPQQGELQPIEPVPPPYKPMVNTIRPANPTAQVNRVAVQPVIFDEILAENIAVTDVRRSKTNDGYQRVQVFIKSQSEDRLRVKFRFDWEDPNGVVVQDLDHDVWEKTTIVPGDERVLTSVAPKKSCADFKLRMKTIH